MGDRKASVSADNLSAECTNIEVRRASLERRLDDGYLRIDEAALSGTDVSEWESFWIRLLREYEDVCREQDLAA
jgi:hypothetical protein